MAVASDKNQWFFIRQWPVFFMLFYDGVDYNNNIKDEAKSLKRYRYDQEEVQNEKELVNSGNCGGDYADRMFGRHRS